MANPNYDRIAEELIKFYKSDQWELETVLKEEGIGRIYAAMSSEKMGGYLIIFLWRQRDGAVLSEDLAHSRKITECLEKKGFIHFRVLARECYGPEGR